MKSKFYSILILFVAGNLFCSFSSASEISMNTGQFQAMDKITGRVSIIEIPVGGAVSFGSFSVVLRDCKTRTQEEIPENFAFVDIADKSFNMEEYNIFKGWMFSSSPALNAVEHPIYDVWLLKCFDSDVNKDLLLSETALKERDNLPRLSEVVSINQELAQNTLVLDEPKNISFKNDMYKEDQISEKTDTTDQKIQGEPQNLLKVDENYMSEDEAISMSAEEFNKALSEEVAKLEKNDEKAPDSAFEKQLETIIDDDIDVESEIEKELNGQN